MLYIWHLLAGLSTERSRLDQMRPRTACNGKHYPSCIRRVSQSYSLQYAELHILSVIGALLSAAMRPPLSGASTLSAGAQAAGAVPTGRVRTFGGRRPNRPPRLLPALPPRAARYVLAVDALAPILTQRVRP